MPRRGNGYHELRKWVFTAALLAVPSAGVAASAHAVDCNAQIDIIERQLTGPDQQVANQAALCIGTAPSAHTEAFQALTDVINRPNASAQLKEASAWAAGRIAENQAVSPDLAAHLAGGLIPFVQDSHQPTSFRRACAYTLGRLSESLPSTAPASGSSIAGQSVAALSQILSDRTDPWTSNEHLALLATAAEAVGRYRHQGRLAVPDITHFLRNSQDALQREKGLTKDQTDTILHVQSVMAATLGKLPLDAASTDSGLALLALLKQDDNISLQSALYALGNLGPRPEIQDGAMLIIKQLHSGDFAIRQVSAYALGRIHPASYQAEALKGLAEALTDHAPQVQEAASQAIDQFDPKYSFATLPRFAAAIAAEDDPDVRTSLLRTLASVAQKEVAAVAPGDRKSAIKILRDADSGLKQTRDSLKKTDRSYGPVLNAIDVVEQSERSIRGSWLRNLFTSHPAMTGSTAVYLAWVAICLVLFRWSPLKVLGWNQTLRNAVDLDIPLPFGLGRFKVPMRYALFIGIFKLSCPCSRCLGCPICRQCKAKLAPTADSSGETNLRTASRVDQNLADHKGISFEA